MHVHRLHAFAVEVDRPEPRSYARAFLELRHEFLHAAAYADEPELQQRQELEAMRESLGALRTKVEQFEAILLRHQTDEKAARVRFAELTARWLRETTDESSDFQAMVMHDAYQQIIGLGPVAIPLILTELLKAPDAWDPALHAITGADPVPSDDVGDMRATADAWIRWGRSRGYI